MTLTKSARTLRLGGLIYRWIVGKSHDGVSSIVVETPEKAHWSFRCKVTETDPETDETKGIPVTPAMVKEFIREKIAEDGVRFFSVQDVQKGLVSLAEHRAHDDVVIGSPVRLSPGTALKDEENVTWVVMRVVGSQVVLNRSGLIKGTRFFLYPRKK